LTVAEITDKFKWKVNGAPFLPQRGRGRRAHIRREGIFAVPRWRSAALSPTSPPSVI